MKDIIEAVMKAREIAFNEAIEANTVLINKEFGKVLPFSFEGQEIPPMICGLKAYISKDIPEDLGFLMLKSKAIETAPTIDAVPVIRCAECKHWNIREGNDPTLNYFCNRDGMWCKPIRKPTDFCSYGEPRGERKE